MTLRYPMEIGGAAAPDYIEFVPSEYRTNQEQRRNATAPSRGDAQAVILYMPNTTPGVGNAQQWGDVSFMGPIGEVVKDLGIGAANLTYAEGGVSGMVDSFTSSLTQLRDNHSGNVGGILRQKAMEMVAGAARADASQLMAFAKGQVYNPNVELLYKSPSMRGFNFAFKFVPKNSGEAQQVNRIIKNFKKWSAPAELQNGMFEVPHVWQVKYMSGGRPNDNMNKFKLAACVSVTVQANPQTTMHVAHPDGVPIETSISLGFREVDIITRADHDEGNQGY